MELKEVTNDQLAKEFLLLQPRLYKDDPNYIRPLNKDVKAVFNKNKNKFFRHGRLKRWVLFKNGKCIGRVAAFINDRLANTYDQPTGGMGFFECIDNQEAANILFDACREWLASEGMEAMDGPINFGERDRFWGLLVDCFEPPTYLMNYNFPYYQDLFENYGFKVYFRQFTFYRFMEEPLSPDYREKANRIAANSDYTFRYIDKKDLDTAGEWFRDVYNKAWGGSHANFKGMRKEQAMAILKSMKPILIDHLIWFGFHKGEPVSFFIMLPEVNRIFKHLNGKLDLIGKLKFLWYRYMVKTRHVYGVIFGVTPRHRGIGVEGAMVQAAADCLQPMKQYIDIEMNWIGEFNPKMISIVEKIGAKRKRTYHTYRYLFDRTKEFKTAPFANEA